MIEKFKAFHKLFKTTKLWQDMEATCENSPWHREANVAVHTQMILDHYLNTAASKRTPRQQAITLMSILFHDTGKPWACTEKHSEKRGKYFSFGGHEQISSRIFENYAVQHWNKWNQIKDLFELKDTDFYIIQWIIQNHLPHDLSKPEDIQRLANHFSHPLWADEDLRECYFDQCLSDQTGRISDNHEANLWEVVEWIDLIRNCAPEEFHVPESPILSLLVGASGSGKSTTSNQLVADGYKYISLDALRIEFAASNGVIGEGAVETYKNAFDYCDKHRSMFNRFADVAFDKMLKDYDSIVVDNTNVNRKSRMGYGTKARASQYKLKAYLFPIERSELLNRANSRTDKNVPIVAVCDQYARTTMPWLGAEVDEVIIITSNI